MTATRIEVWVLPSLIKMNVIPGAGLGVLAGDFHRGNDGAGILVGSLDLMPISFEAISYSFETSVDREGRLECDTASD